MESQMLKARYGAILGGCLFAIGVGGGITMSLTNSQFSSNSSLFGFIALIGILIAILSLGIFGFLLPLVQ